VIDELREVVAEPRERRQVVHASGRAPVRARVPGKHLVAVREPGRDGAPVGVRATEAVQQQHRPAGA
jgi:hypothetical protein